MLAPIPLIFALTHHARGLRKAFAGLAAALMAASIFLSGSRGGMLALVAEMAVLATIVAWQKQGRRKVAVALAVLLVAGVALLVWLGGGELSQRLASIHTETRTELTGGTRLDIDRDALKMFTRKPLLGWGLGVFPRSIRSSGVSIPISSSMKRTTTICNCWSRWAVWDLPRCCGSSLLCIAKR